MWSGTEGGGAVLQGLGVSRKEFCSAGGPCMVVCGAAHTGCVQGKRQSWKALEEFQGEAEASTWVLAVGVVRSVYSKETPHVQPTDGEMNDSDLLSI